MSAERMACRFCGLALTLMHGIPVCCCCGGGRLPRDSGCRHLEPLASWTVPYSCEDVEIEP